MRANGNDRDGEGQAATAEAPDGPAARALAEAAERRRLYLREEAGRPKEIGGRGGKEPVRYGDWEIKGIAADF